MAKKEGRRSVKVADIDEFWRGQKYIKLLDPNLLACKESIDLLEQLADTKAYIDFSQGLDCRLITKDHVDIINRIKLKNIHFAWDSVKDEKSVLRGLECYAKRSNRKLYGGYATVYVLTNYGSTFEEDKYRIDKLWSMGFYPYVMIYDKPNAPKILRRLQRWCNNRIIFKSCSFEDYKG